jgi:predicted PhzF superfamily epimerase YddE/YHI9
MEYLKIPSAAAAMGALLRLSNASRLLDRKSYTSAQGRSLQRDGRVEIRFDEDASIWLGGHAVTCIEGFLTAK